MQTLTTVQTKEINGGIGMSPFLEWCVTSLPAVGTIEGGLLGSRIPTGNETEVYSNIAIGGGFGFVAGLFMAVGLTTDAVKRNTGF